MYIFGKYLQNMRTILCVFLIDVWLKSTILFKKVTESQRDTLLVQTLFTFCNKLYTKRAEEARIN